MRLTAALAALAVLLALSPPEARAEGPAGLSVRADSMSTGPSGEVEATGGVEVTGPDLRVRADRLSYDPSTGTVRLSGNVRFTEAGGSVSEADAVDLDLATLTGGIRGGRITVPSTGLTIRGDSFRRTGPDRYEVEGAVFTTCPGDCPDWSFSAGSLHLRSEGYLTARGAAFRIRGVPVLYIPWLIYPVKTRRQSGLLIPTVRFSEGAGWEGAFPLFLTLGPSADATLTPRTFSRDTTGLGAEVRYLLELGGGGEWTGFTASGEEGRWHYRGRHAMPLGPGLWWRGRWYDASSPEVPRDFALEFEDRTPGAVERHWTVEARSGALEGWIKAESLAADALRARLDTLSTMDRLEAGAGATAVPLGPLSLGLGLRFARFPEEGQRLVASPSAALDLSGPGGARTRLHGTAWLADDSEGTRGGAFAVYGLEEAVSVERNAPWGRHRLDLDASAARSGEEVFAEGDDRDAGDRARAVALLAVRLRSLLEVGTLRWDLRGGAWRDAESDRDDHFASTEVRVGGWSLRASRNRDGALALSLPASGTAPDAARGWTAALGWRSERAAFSLGGESESGSPDLLLAEYRVPFHRLELDGRTQYDGDAGREVESSTTLTWAGRCWKAGLNRTRSGDRVSWRLDVSLADGGERRFP